MLKASKEKQAVQWFAPFQSTAFYKGAERFLQSDFFPPALAVIALLSNLLGLDLIAFGLITACFVFINLFIRDSRPAIPVLLTAVFCVSQKNSPGYGDGTDFYMSPPVLAVLITYVVLIFATAVFHLFYYRQFRAPHKRTLLPGLALVCAACFLGGIASDRYDPQNLLIGAMQLFSLLLVYLYFTSTYTWRKTDTVYLARICATVGTLVALQVLGFYIASDFVLGETALDNAWKGGLVIGWGVSNVVGTVMLIMLPMYFYLMQADRKRGWLYYLSAIGVVIAIFFTLCRSAVLIGVPLLLIGMVFCCILKKGNRLLYRIMTGVFVAAAAALVIVVLTSEFGDPILAFFKETRIDDRGRFDLWLNDVFYFLASPLFGEGFAARYVDLNGAVPLMQVFSHNTIVCMLGKCGLFGLLTYLFHRFQTLKLFFKKPDMTRTFLGIATLCYVASGLLDNIFFFVYTTLFYIFFLMFAERLLQDKLEESAAVLAEPAAAPAAQPDTE